MQQLSAKYSRKTRQVALIMPDTPASYQEYDDERNHGNWRFVSIVVTILISLMKMNP